MGEARGDWEPPGEAAMPTPAIKVMLVGARLFAEALAASLMATDDIDVVGVHPDPVRAIDHARAAVPDIIILDDTAAQLDVTRLISLLRGAQADVRIIILSIAINAQALASYVRAGAVGYITVDRALAELIDALRQVGNGRVLFEADQLMDVLSTPRNVRIGSTLAPRELQVLQVLATGKSTEEAATELGISVHTLRTHLKKCMTKMDARSKLEAIILALRAGLIELPR
jgi:NarL family two-component system response regulator LiaR